LINNAYKTVKRSALFNKILRSYKKPFLYSHQLMYCIDCGYLACWNNAFYLHSISRNPGKGTW